MTFSIKAIIRAFWTPERRITCAPELWRKIVGERTKREFSIGDEATVRLDRVDAVDRKLQFSLVEPEAGTKTRKQKKKDR